MKYIALYSLILSHCFYTALAQDSSEPAADSPETEFIEIIQSPPPIEPVEVFEPETDDHSDLPADIPAPELPQLLPLEPEGTTDTEEKSEDTASEKAEPEKPAGPKRLKFPAVDNVLLDPPLPPHPHGTIPQSSGDTTGDIYIAHRSVVEKYNGWGWVKHESESWSDAQWVTVREKLGKVIVPGRHLKHTDNDDGMQYRFYGEFSSETAYEPNKDVFIAIFNLKGFEVIGPAKKPFGATLPQKATGSTRSKPTTGGARSNPFRR
ncbi:MAG: hypothetical protein AAF571_10315 [Verrucomicrobiota bacterium]